MGVLAAKNLQIDTGEASPEYQAIFLKTLKKVGNKRRTSWSGKARIASLMLGIIVPWSLIAAGATALFT